MQLVYRHGRSWFNRIHNAREALAVIDRNVGIAIHEYNKEVDVILNEFHSSMPPELRFFGKSKDTIKLTAEHAQFYFEGCPSLSTTLRKNHYGITECVVSITKDLPLPTSGILTTRAVCCVPVDVDDHYYKVSVIRFGGNRHTYKCARVLVGNVDVISSYLNMLDGLLNTYSRDVSEVVLTKEEAAKIEECLVFIEDCG